MRDVMLEGSLSETGVLSIQEGEFVRESLRVVLFGTFLACLCMHCRCMLVFHQVKG